jgi:hypothetical protein
MHRNCAPEKPKVINGGPRVCTLYAVFVQCGGHQVCDDSRDCCPNHRGRESRLPQTGSAETNHTSGPNRSLERTLSRCRSSASLGGRSTVRSETIRSGYAPFRRLMRPGFGGRTTARADKFMSRMATFAYRFLCRLRAFISRLFPISARAAAPSGPFRGPDILDVRSDGTVRVTRATGPSPVGPRTVADATFINPRAQRLARRAAIFLFEYLDFASVPAHFWPVFEKTYDPAAAMDEFLRAVGCDPELIRRKDAAETRKAQDVIELLVRSGDILHSLAPHVRQIVGRQLESGDYEKVRRVAEVVAHLSAALDFAAPWSGRPVVASFADLLRTLQRMLSEPLAVEPATAASTVSLIGNYTNAQRQFDACVERFAGLSKDLQDSWPREWHGTSQETHLRDHVGNFEAVAETMRVSADLTWENLREGNEALWADIDALDRLLQQAREPSRGPRGARSGRDRRDRPSEPPPGGDDKEKALRYFGFSSAHRPVSKEQLRAAWMA